VLTAGKGLLNKDLIGEEWDAVPIAQADDIYSCGQGMDIHGEVGRRCPFFYEGPPCDIIQTGDPGQVFSGYTLYI
jgi:hypothetical protein